MAKTKKKVQRKKVKIKKKRKKSKVALILSIIAIVFLVINSFYLLAKYNEILSEMQEAILTANASFEIAALESAIIAIIIIWFVLAVIMAYLTYMTEKKKIAWYGLLIVSIISLLVARIDTAVLGIIASILYKRQNKK